MDAMGGGVVVIGGVVDVVVGAVQLEDVTVTIPQTHTD
jgi:hypothetical protein